MSRLAEILQKTSASTQVVFLVELLLVWSSHNAASCVWSNTSDLLQNYVQLL